MSLRPSRSTRRRSRHEARIRGAGSRSARGPLTLEQLEGRQVLAALFASETYVVSTLADAGPGSLRQAILDANAHKGADAIDFSVAGTISLKSALPSITESLEIDGASDLGYVGRPVVTLDFQNSAGLVVAAGADGSVIKSLSLVDSSNAGISLAASGVTVAGNFIGLRADGTTIESNRGDGVAILAGAHDNVIGSGGSASTFQLSNVISGNRGNGVSITGPGATNNHVAMNFIGTDLSGTLRRGNGGNGVVITAGASKNLIGGEATGGNDPTKGVFVRPPQGNLISGNYAGGVLISAGAEFNQVSGNYVGTKASGLAPLGNALDGVAIVGADNNSLLGTTLNQNPFVFSNVLSGNGGNGLRITDSDNTTVYANFIGLGRNNKTPVPNGGNGLLVSGNSQGVTLGGVIPLGNVISGNKGKTLPSGSNCAPRYRPTREPAALAASV